MATLKGTTISETYPLLLKIASSGVDGTLRNIEDGDGTASALQISSSAVNVNGTIGSTGAITQGSGVLTIKNATGDSNGLRIFQDTGDASKIYNHYNGTLQLGVGNTTALTIDSSENSTFAGNIALSTAGAGLVDDASNNIIERTAGGYITIGDSAWNEIRLNTTGSTDFVLDNSGRVGIGASPESKLAVKGSSGDADLFSISDVAVPTSGAEYGTAMIKTNSTEYALNITSYNASGKGLRIYNNGGQNAFLVTQAGGDRFVVDGSGNVGIGLSNSSVNNKFQVQVGTDHRIGFWGSSSYSAIQSVNDANSAQQDLRFDASAFYFLSGSVGIGTTSPNELLEVSSDTGTSTIDPTVIRISTTANGSGWDGTTDWGRLEFYSADASGSSPGVHVSLGARTASSTGSSSGFNIGLLNNPDAHFINSTGEATITNKSSASTTVSNVLTLKHISSVATGVGHGAAIKFNLQRANGTLQGAGSFESVTTTNSSSVLSTDFTFNPAVGGVSTERMRITSDGLVQLNQNNAGSAGTGLKQLSLGASSSTIMDFTNSGTMVGAIVSNSSNDQNTGCAVVFSHRTGSSGISYIASRNEGSDASSLHFGTRGSAGVREEFRIDKNGNLTANDTSIGTLSDERLKTNIQDYDGGLDLIKQLRPRTFEWKENTKGGSGTKRGLIAQEVASVDNYWIDEIDAEPNLPDFEYVEDTGMIYTSKLGAKDAMYISAIKSLVSKIDALTARIEALEA